MVYYENIVKCRGSSERRLFFPATKKLEIMFKTNQSGRLMVDEIKVEAQLLRNKIADIIEEVYVTLKLKVWFIMNYNKGVRVVRWMTFSTTP